jgi:hypothetical protein
MTSLDAVIFYVGVHLLLLAYISFNVGRNRIRHKVNLGDGGNEEVLRAVRAQGNYIEYTPLALLGLYGLSAAGFSVWVIHLFGLTYTIARLLHFIGLGLNKMEKGRFYGTIGTMLVLLIMGATLIIRSFL